MFGRGLACVHTAAFVFRTSGIAGPLGGGGGGGGGGRGLAERIKNRVCAHVDSPNLQAGFPYAANFLYPATIAARIANARKSLDRPPRVEGFLMTALVAIRSILSLAAVLLHQSPPPSKEEGRTGVRRVARSEQDVHVHWDRGRGALVAERVEGPAKTVSEGGGREGKEAHFLPW